MPMAEAGSRARRRRWELASWAKGTLGGQARRASDGRWARQGLSALVDEGVSCDAWRQPGLELPCSGLSPPRRDAALVAGPSGVERAPRFVDIDDERRVVGRNLLTLACFAINLGSDRTARERGGDEQVVDAHAEVLVKHAG